MAAADQIKSLINSYVEGDDARFFGTAMQIAASEARQGHTTVAQELKKLIDKAKKERSDAYLIEPKTVPFSGPKRDLKELIEVFHPRIKFNDMVLAPQVKEIFNALLNEQSQWQLLQKHNLSPKRKLLLKGSPGTGKTMSAQAIAGELNLAVYIIRLDGLMSKYMGESIAKLRMIFDAMQDHRAVYLFDEFDSIGSHRDKGQDVGEIKRVLNSFLVNIEKDTSNSVIIAATNLPESLDKALFRRFDEIIDFPLPDQDEIIRTIKKSVRTFTFSKKVNYHEIAEKADGLNFSDIVKACEETIKDMLLSGAHKLDSSLLEQSLLKRKI